MPYLNGERKFKIENSSEFFKIRKNVLEFENHETEFDVELANDCEVGRYKTTLTLRGFGHSMYDQRTIRLVILLNKGNRRFRSKFSGYQCTCIF